MAPRCCNRGAIFIWYAERGVTQVQAVGEERAARLAQLCAEPLDVLVIGGGIVGAGVARDAAMRRFRTAVIEQADFASAPAAPSSLLLPGGMRYLAQGRIALVPEESREKRVIGHIAPHLARPL